MTYLKSPQFWLAIGAALLIVPFIDVAVNKGTSVREISDLQWVGSRFCVWAFLALIVAAGILKIIVPIAIKITKLFK